MNSFDYENYLKKRLAHQASHRKCGSKSKRCFLSTDHMTRKQWEERNGKVVSVNFDRPTRWENFKELSKGTQEEYLRHLTETYNANVTSLAVMFGVSTPTVRRHIQSAGLDIKFRAGHSMSKRQRDVWEQFLHSAQENIVVNNMTEEEQATLIEKINTSPAGRVFAPMRMSKFSLCFTGPIDVEMIANSLRQILGDDAQGEIRIMCDLTKCC